jgi:predicted  nucleic acid-binding Zn-ribbon protein
MARLNLFKRVHKAESTIDVLEKDILDLKKENKVRGIKKRLDTLESKLDDFNNGMKLLEEANKNLKELMETYKANAQKQEQLEQELRDYWDFNK